MCLAFRLCSSMIVFYTSLEVMKLAFFEKKSRYNCCVFTNFIFTLETKRSSMFQKNKVMCILQTQSITLYFLNFSYPQKPESGTTCNKE